MTINQNRSFLPCMNYKQLQEFRQQVYDLLNFAQDATFELTDAVLTTRHVYSKRRIVFKSLLKGGSGPAYTLAKRGALSAQPYKTVDRIATS